MRDQILKSVRTLAAVLPLLVLAHPAAAQREGSWEFSAGGGIEIVDHALRNFLVSKGFTTTANPGSIAPAVAVRVGYNVNNNLGLSIGTAGAKGSGIKYLTPFAALTYTVNLSARTSPFLTLGTQFTRITGNGRKEHPTWGAHLGAGLRHMISPNVALRLEGRMAVEHYEELPGKKTAYNPIVTLGLSYFTAGRKAAAAPECPTCTPMVRVRVDTVRVQAPPPPPIIHYCTRGIAPPGVQMDAYGCLVLTDTLLLEGVHFAFDKSDLTERADSILDRVAESMMAHPEAYFEIAGHTDSVGTFAYNYLLSARRANAVRNELITEGVPAYRMTAVGYGEGFPIAPNATVEGRALNRRGIQIRVKKP
jgi:outer membrane protein OmpA-like peptidoglycan-associated protein